MVDLKIPPGACCMIWNLVYDDIFRMSFPWGSNYLYVLTVGYNGFIASELGIEILSAHEV